jgi:hypothetical protein
MAPEGLWGKGGNKKLGIEMQLVRKDGQACPICGRCCTIRRQTREASYQVLGPGVLCDDRGKGVGCIAISSDSEASLACFEVVFVVAAHEI